MNFNMLKWFKTKFKFRFLKTMDNFKENLPPEKEIVQQEEILKGKKVSCCESFKRIFTDKKKIIIGIGVGIIIVTGGILIWQLWPNHSSISPNPSSLSIAPTSSILTAIIEGSLGYPSDFIPPDMKICAENQQTGEEYCTEEHIKDEKYTYGEGYRLTVPFGNYLVYATTFRLQGEKAYYSEFVICGMSVECSSHKSIIVSVEKGDIVANIDPMDWYVSPEQENETADWKTYTNEEYGFEIKHPKEYTIVENKNSNIVTIKINKPIINRDCYTNFIEEIHLSTNNTISDDCLSSRVNLPTSNEKYLEQISKNLTQEGWPKIKAINSSDFYRTYSTDSAMGGKSKCYYTYQTFHNNQCYEITLQTYSNSNFGFVDNCPTSLKAQYESVFKEVKRKLQELRNELFFQILSTFKFID